MFGCVCAYLYMDGASRRQRRLAAMARGDRRRRPQAGEVGGSRMLQLVAFTEEKRTEYARVPGDGGWERGEGGMSHWSGGWAETCW